MEENNTFQSETKISFPNILNTTFFTNKGLMTAKFITLITKQITN